MPKFKIHEIVIILTTMEPDTKDTSDSYPIQAEIIQADYNDNIWFYKLKAENREKGNYNEIDSLYMEKELRKIM